MSARTPNLDRPLLSYYGMASLASVLALALAFLLQPMTGVPPFVLFIAAVMFASWSGGLRSGLLATTILVLASSYFLIPPLYSLKMTDPNDRLHLGLFILVALLTSSVHQKLRFARRRMQALVRAREESLQREQQARCEAEGATRAKDEFVAIVSHELRAPLMSIMGWTEILRRIDQSDKEGFDQALETIDRNVKLQAKLINDLMDMSRIVAGKVRLDICPVDLSSVIDSSVDIIRSAAERKGIRLLIDKAPSVGRISGDPDRLRQVIWNLMSNAVKFTPEGGSISLSLKYLSCYAQVTIRDTGKGMSADFLPYVFDRFRQADNTRTDKQDGLGLGLTIARHLVELHGGTIRAASAGEGHGSVFIVRLPPPAAQDVARMRENMSPAPHNRPIAGDQKPVDRLPISL